MFHRRMTVSRSNSSFNNRSKSFKSRKVDQFSPRKTILVVCQGEQTEPNYFKKFGSEWLTVRIETVGKDVNAVIDRAKKIKKDFDEIWVVFDKDDFSDSTFDNAIQSAKSSKIKVAYSNECFEVWYILHFEFLNTEIPRKEYYTKLEKILNCKYAKNNNFMYERLKDRMGIAIANAKRLIDLYGTSSHPSKDNPSTTVHLLVQELIEQAKPRYR